MEYIKSRVSNHFRSFRNPKLRNVTSLAKLIHRYKDRKKEYNIYWRILSKNTSYPGGRVECLLCVNESFHILTRGGGGLTPLVPNLLLICCTQRHIFLTKSAFFSPLHKHS